MKLFSLFCFLLSIGSLPAEPVSIDLASSEDERKEMGIDQLNDTQKKAFENWLGAWTKKVLDASRTYHPAMNLNQWIQNWPQYLQENPKETPETQKEELKELSTILRNVNGTTLVLKNGSEWRIVDSDRFNTRFWMRDTPIEIRENKRDITRPYILINRALNDQAGATKLKDAAPTPYEEPPGYFRSSFQIKRIETGGQGVLLINNTAWRIAPVDQLLVSTTWKVHDRIRVESSDDVSFPNRLNNLDSGSIVQAIKR